MRTTKRRQVATTLNRHTHFNMESAHLQAIWGKKVSQDVFKRWNQGFVFSKDEPLALVQNSGGPCAVLAPVQAFIFQKRLYGNKDNEWRSLDREEWRSCTNVEAQDLLISALTTILQQANAHSSSCKIATLNNDTKTAAMPMNVVTVDTNVTTPPKPQVSSANNSGGLKRKHPSPLSEEKSDVKRDPSTGGGCGLSDVINIEQLIKDTQDVSGCGDGHGLTLEALSSALSNVKATGMSLEAQPIDTAITTTGFPLSAPLSGSETCTLTTNKGPGSVELTPSLSTNDGKEKSEIFHANIRVNVCSSVDDIRRCLRESLSDLSGPFGVLLFLYSVVLTKGIEQLTEESEENEQPLIDPLHGHGSQNLINMLLVGRCVTNVFDLDQDLGGIKLRGIPYQSTVGFLSILEALRYCEVGSYLKCPQYPVWVIGSETHLTVLFSIEIGLTLEEDVQTVAKREFAQFSYNGEPGLMATSMLGELLKRLDLETDPDYVEYMKGKLDTEKTGVILLGDFLSEFYPHPMEFEKPKAFTVYHYNGLLHNKDEKVHLVRGQATVLLGEEGSTNTEVSLINCLHTKWPSLIIHWDEQCEPKII